MAPGKLRGLLWSKGPKKFSPAQGFPIVLVIDPEDFAKRTRGYLRSLCPTTSTALGRQRSKLDNEHEHDSGIRRMSILAIGPNPSKFFDDACGSAFECAARLDAGDYDGA